MVEYLDLSREAWDASLESHANRYRIPEKLTAEQALEHFSQIGPVALKSLTLKYINKARAKNELSPLPSVAFSMPDNLATWIKSQVAAIDTVSGHVGSKTYQTIANAMLTQLRAIEHTYLGHHD